MGGGVRTDHDDSKFLTLLSAWLQLLSSLLVTDLAPFQAILEQARVLFSGDILKEAGLIFRMAVQLGFCQLSWHFY